MFESSETPAWTLQLTRRLRQAAWQLQGAGREPVSCMQAEKKEKELKRKGFSSEAQINKSRSFFKVNLASIALELHHSQGMR